MNGSHEMTKNQGCRTGLFISLLVAVVMGMGLLAIVVFVTKAPSSTWTLSSRASIGILDIEGPIFDVRVPLKQLASYSNNASVKAVVVRINSPGGAVAPSQELFEELKRVRNKGKKVVVSMGSVAASGGSSAPMSG